MDFLFSENDILSFTYFWKPLLQLGGGQYFFKKILLKTVFFNFFFQILIQMEEAFRSSEIAFFKESFILASGNGFSINYKLCAFNRSFFSLVDTILKLDLNQFSSIFSIPNSASSFFRLVEADFLFNASFRRVGTDFLLSVLLFRANFVLVEMII